MTRVLITGGSGFIGRHILTALATREGLDIHAVNRSGGPPAGSATPGVSWHAADLADARQADRLARSVKADLLLHAAWIATPGVYASAPANLDWLTASVALAHAFGQAGGKHMLGVGSSAEYADSAGPCREDDTPIHPASIYGKAKAACWLALQAAGQAGGFSTGWARLFLPYGAGDPPQRLIPNLLAMIAAGETIRTTDGLQVRDFVDAADAGAMMAGLLLARASGAFNIGTGEGTRVRDVVSEVARLRGAEHLLAIGALPRRAGEPESLVPDMTKTRAVLPGFSPVSLRQRLASLCATGSP